MSGDMYSIGMEGVSEAQGLESQDNDASLYDTILYLGNT